MVRLKFFFFFLMVSVYATAQTACGIFATRSDFMEKKVTYAFENCDFKVQNNKDIVGDHANNDLRFKFDFIYGYTDGKDLYRAYGLQTFFTDHGYYRVIYDNDVVVYARTSRDHRSKLQTFLYYSLAKDSPIHPLKRKFYRWKGDGKNIAEIHLAALREELKLQAIDGPQYAVIEGLSPDEFNKLSFGQKKKPDISARLQTTTRRPKVFNVRSW